MALLKESGQLRHIDLVVVGGSGWKNRKIYEMIQEHEWIKYLGFQSDNAFLCCFINVNSSLFRQYMRVWNACVRGSIFWSKDRHY